MKKIHICEALIYLNEEYKKAIELDFVRKPISYALYNTWKHFDAIEKSRNSKEESKRSV